MLISLRAKLKRIEQLEQQMNIGSHCPSPETNRVMRAYMRWKFERQVKLYERRDAGDESANVEPCQTRDRFNGLSDTEKMERIADEINELLRTGQLDQHMDTWGDPGTSNRQGKQDDKI